MYLNARNREMPISAAYSYYVSVIPGMKLRYGTDAGDYFDGSSGDTLIGGKGDDWYTLWSSNITVTENAGEGVDTVYVQYWGAATLAANVENLVLVNEGATAGTGNALGNIITAGKRGATLNGKSGDDVLVGGAGADVFVVEAGTGSDAIVNFAKGSDAILLKGFGITGFDQVLKVATQVGSDVFLTFGSDLVAIRGVTLSGLHAADFGMLDPSQILTTSPDSLLYKWVPELNDFDPTPITLAGAGKCWNSHGWYVLNNMWGTQGLIEGVDYAVNSTFSRGDMTKGVTFNWLVPYTTDVFATVKGYPAVIFGVSPHGDYAGDPTDKAFVFPVQVSRLMKLDADFDVSWSGNTAGFNVAYDIWLTSVPNGDASKITNEIMVWVHKPATGVIPGSVVGTFVHEGVSASIYHTGTYTAVVFDQDVPKGKLDIAGLLTTLQKLGIVSPDEYVASIELGAEAMSGVGSLTINDLDLTVMSRTDKGTAIIKQVGGDKTVVSEVSLLPVDYQAGVTDWVTDHGLVAGTRSVTLEADGSATVRFLNESKALVSYQTASIDLAGVLTVLDYSASGKLTGVEVRQIGGDTTTTRHFDALHRLTDWNSVTVADDGSTTTRFYDANGKLIGTDIVNPADQLAHPQGRSSAAPAPDPESAIATSHFDGDGKLVSVDVTSTVNGVTVTQRYDAANKLLGTDVSATDADGHLTVDHYKANGKLLNSVVFETGADGSITSTTYNGRGVMTGRDVESTDADGVSTIIHANGSGRQALAHYWGTSADDTLVGGALRANMHGGLGSDTMVRGGKATGFWFETAIGNGDVDRIVGFVERQDTIYVDHQVFTGMHVGKLAASAFELGPVATHAETRFLFDASSGSLLFDADGLGGADAVLFAHIETDRPLMAADIVIV